MEPQIVNPDNSEVVDPAIIAEIEELHRFECGACGYVYEPEKGDSKRGIASGTAFPDLPDDWNCPVCTTRKSRFADIGIKSKPSGFQENLSFGFGVNVMTPTQKNLLIFGSLALGFIFFMSLYALD